MRAQVVLPEALGGALQGQIEALLGALALRLAVFELGPDGLGVARHIVEFADLGANRLRAQWPRPISPIIRDTPRIGVSSDWLSWRARRHMKPKNSR